MGRRVAVDAGAHRKALIAAVLFATTTAVASPKQLDAKVEFDRGVAAYKKGDYATAAEALGSSFALENNEETLFAWAQTERKLGHCDKAIELYTKLLTFKLPAANKQAVQVQINECKAIVAEEKRKQPPVIAEEKRKQSPPPPPEPTPAVVTEGAPPPEAAPPPEETLPPQPVHLERAWWKDLVGGGLVCAGVIGIGIGVVFLVQGAAADRDKDAAASYPEFVDAARLAESNGSAGVIATVTGVALATGGVIWYVTRKNRGGEANDVARAFRRWRGIWRAVLACVIRRRSLWHARTRAEPHTRNPYRLHDSLTSSE